MSSSWSPPGATLADVDRFDAAQEVLGHKLTPRRRRYGKTTHHWVTCSCGYESKPGKSLMFATNAGIGHVKRVADKLRREEAERREVSDGRVALDVRQTRALGSGGRA
jgi:hypothetical protein